MVPDSFIEYYYGKCKILDLHNLTKENAKIELIHEIGKLDNDVDCLIVVHGYHGGVVIKNLVRKEFENERIAEKIALDAGRTIYKLKKI